MQESFLLSNSKIFDKSQFGAIEYSYDDSKDMNIVIENGVSRLAVQSQKFAPTQSKTMAAPGDDDPDHDRCY